MGATDKEKKYSFGSLIHDLYGFIRPYKRKFFTATLLRVIGDIVNLYPAWALASVINILAKGNSEEEVNKIALLMVGWIIARLLRSNIKQWAKYFGYQVAERIDLDAKLKALNHIYSLDMSWQEKLNSGSKLKKVNNGGRGMQELLRVYFSILIETVVNTIGICIVLLTLDEFLSISLFIFIILFYSLSFRLFKKAAGQEYTVKKKEEYLEGIAFESVNNIQTVKALNLKGTILTEIRKAVDDLFKNIKRRIYLFQISIIWLAVLASLFEFLMYVYLIYQIVQGNYQVGVIVLFGAYLEKTMAALWELSDITQSVFVYKIWVQRMMELMQIKPTIETGDKIGKYPENWTEMTFTNVKFSYGDRNTIDDLGLTIKRGEKIGIVGLSGAGKSTLFKLLLDLYRDYEGDIKIGEVNLKEIDRANYINNLAVVLQDTELFNASLEENIKIAGIEGVEITENEIQNIYKTAYLTDLLEKLPNGKDTIVGEKGIKLSGGERQRVGIARALYRKPDILLLDEATSHLDADSEKKIQSALKEFFNKVTAIVIAHRLSTLKEMDRIIVLHEGKIVEQGTFEQLLKKNGHFTKLWKMQRI